MGAAPLQDCPYLNPAKRGVSWQAKPDIKKNFDSIRSQGGSNRKSVVLRSVEAKLKKQAREVSKLSPVAFDDGSASYGRNANACLQVGAAKQSPPTLLTRWILDPGSNLHLTNHRNSTWRKIADANNDDEIWASDQRIKIEEWGEVKIIINTPKGTAPIKLSWVALVPSFFTSLVALSRCRTMGIEFDSGRDCLYQKSLKNVVCKLDFKGGH